MRLTRHAMLLVLVAASPALAVQPVQVSHSGYLLDAQDAPLDAAGASLGFSLWSAAQGGAQAWPASGESACTAAVKRGYYSLVLDGAAQAGCGAGLTAELIAGAPWLRVSVQGVPLDPRIRLSAAPRALLADRSLDSEALAARLAATTGTLNDATNPVHWSQLFGVPAAIRDGVQVGAGAGITVSGAGTLAAPYEIALAYDAASLARVSGGAIAANASGNLGVGTAATANRMEVAGTVSATQFVGGGAGLTNVNAAMIGSKTLADLDLRYLSGGGGGGGGGGMGVARHDANASAARPADSLAAYWVGSVAPLNALSGDLFFDTTPGLGQRL